MNRYSYEKLEFIYNRLGQFAYFNQSDEGEVSIIKEKTLNTNELIIAVEAKTIARSILYRRIVVFQNGYMFEEEFTNRSLLKRQRVIYDNGKWDISFNNINDGLAYGYKRENFPDGEVIFGEIDQNIWRGYNEIFEANGDRRIGTMFDNKSIGKFKIIKKEDNSVINGHSGI